MKFLEEISDRIQLRPLRPETGKIYGPEFIELGIKIGEKIYRLLQGRFSDELY